MPEFRLESCKWMNERSFLGLLHFMTPYIQGEDTSERTNILFIQLFTTFQFSFYIFLLLQTSISYAAFFKSLFAKDLPLTFHKHGRIVYSSIRFTYNLWSQSQYSNEVILRKYTDTTALNGGLIFRLKSAPDDAKHMMRRKAAPDAIFKQERLSSGRFMKPRRIKYTYTHGLRASCRLKHNNFNYQCNVL